MFHAVEKVLELVFFWCGEFSSIFGVFTFASQRSQTLLKPLETDFQFSLPVSSGLRSGVEFCVAEKKLEVYFGCHILKIENQIVKI